jgi:hypothetical protein
MEIATADYEPFESWISVLEKIVEEWIGVYGIGGVGKMTLVKEVYWRATLVKPFDEVVSVLDVKQNPNLERIQKEISETPGLDAVENETRVGIAPYQRDRTKDEKIRVILDDVCDKIDFKAGQLPSFC